MSGWLSRQTLVGVAAVSAGAMGGVFFAFSTFVMPALGRLRAPHAPEAARTWDGYVRSWTAGNHVRTVAALGASVAWTIARRQPG